MKKLIAVVCLATLMMLAVALIPFYIGLATYYLLYGDTCIEYFSLISGRQCNDDPFTVWFHFWTIGFGICAFFGFALYFSSKIFGGL